MKLYYLLTLIFLSALGTHQAQAQELDVLDEEVVEGDFLKPREAVYWKGGKRIEKNEVIVRSLLQTLEPLENLPLITENLTELPQTKAADTVYDISAWFPNCEGDQWVYYNETSDYLVANASHRLRASVNDYVHRVVDKSLARMRVSVIYLVVDGGVPLTVEAIRKSKFRKVLSYSGEFRSGEKVVFGNDEQQIFMDGIQGERQLSSVVYISLSDEAGQDVEVSAFLEAGVEEVINVGISEGRERSVMILKSECLDMKGRVVNLHQIRSENHYSEGRQYIEWQEYLIKNKSDMISLLGEEKVQLIVPPKSDFFIENDVIYDLRKSMNEQGIEFGADDMVIYNSNTACMIATGDGEALDMLEELTTDLGPDVPTNSLTMARFYEVDAKVPSMGEWNIIDVLASNPVLLGSVGFFQRSGAEVTFRSQQGNAKLCSSKEESGYKENHTYSLDLSLQGRKIKSEQKLVISYDKPAFIELQTDSSTKRTIVMMIIMKQKRIYRY